MWSVVVNTFASLKGIFRPFPESQGICGLKGRGDQTTVGGISRRWWDGTAHKRSAATKHSAEHNRHTTWSQFTQESILGPSERKKEDMGESAAVEAKVDVGRSATVGDWKSRVRLEIEFTGG